MSRKVSPIGFRLGLSQPWVLNAAGYTSFKEILQQFVLYSWLLNFAQQHSFYFLRFHYITTTSYSDFLTLLVLFPFRRFAPFRQLNYVSFGSDLKLFRKRRTKKKQHQPTLLTNMITRHIAKRGLALVTEGSHLGFQTTSFRSQVKANGFFLRNSYLKQTAGENGRYWTSLYLNWYRLQWKRKRTKMNRINHLFSLSPFFSVGKYRRPLVTSIRRRRRRMRVNRWAFSGRKSRGYPVKLRKSVDISQLLKRNYLRFFLYRFFCLRFKQFIEHQLLGIHKKPINVVLQNFTDVFRFGAFSPVGKNRKFILRLFTAGMFLTHRASEFRKYTFLDTLVALVITSSLVRVPHVLMQWVWAYSIRIKKHSLYLSHRQLFNLVCRTLENTILMVGSFKGVRFEIVGKLNDNTRTQKQLTLFGKTFKRQTIFTSFVYAIKHVPTYLGVLGLRLWYIY